MGAWTSDSASVTVVPAAAARRPPLMRDRCLRTQFSSSIAAPARISSRAVSSLASRSTPVDGRGEHRRGATGQQHEQAAATPALGCERERPLRRANALPVRRRMPGGEGGDPRRRTQPRRATRAPRARRRGAAARHGASRRQPYRQRRRSVDVVRGESVRAPMRSAGRGQRHRHPRAGCAVRHRVMSEGRSCSVKLFGIGPGREVGDGVELPEQRCDQLVGVIAGA